jgi:hypothetical protein
VPAHVVSAHVMPPLLPLAGLRSMALAGEDAKKLPVPAASGLAVAQLALEAVELEGALGRLLAVSSC